MGGTFNKEKYSSSLEEFTSAEAFGSIRYEYYPVKGMEFLADFILFPSLTESGRIRSYINTELKFTLIRHFKLGLVYTLNYDNKPPVSSSKSDYILNFKFGWTL
jgi:putative salt-induced outer membrane protein YdiY